jgi:polysaccharide biosynthesis/export protein
MDMQKRKIGLIFLASFLLISCSSRGGHKSLVEDSFIEVPEFVFSPGISRDSVHKILDSLNEQSPNPYRIVTGDVFNVQLMDEVALSTPNAIVKPDLTVTLNLLGEVEVGNLTISQARERIQSEYRRYVRNPRVSLIPVQISQSRVTVLGQVGGQGVYPITNNTRLLDALALAGGFGMSTTNTTPMEVADLHQSFIARNGQLLPVSFKSLVKQGNPRYNIPLSDGDYIYIASALNKEIFVIGEVRSPGAIVYRDGMTLLRVLTQTQGLLPTSKGQVIIVRNSLIQPEVYSVNVKKILKGSLTDIPLRPDDIIYIPPRLLADWNTILGLLLPSLQTLQTGIVLQSLMN